jgi:hypothetical protein
MNLISHRDRLKISLKSQILEFKLSCIDRDKSNESYFSIQLWVQVNGTELESNLFGAWNKGNFSLINVESVHMNLSKFDAVEKISLVEIQGEWFVVNNVPWENSG